MKILLLGGAGILGTELQKLDSNLICPSHKELDINNIQKLHEELFLTSPDIVIHAVALTDNRVVEKNPIEAIQTNIIGTCNVAMACCEFGIRLVYISTDYVYADYDRGNFSEGDCVSPFNFYAKTKLAGEIAVSAVNNHLIIRTSFGKNEFDYPEAFVDKWTSKDYVDVIAPLILEAALSPLTGILNLGTERKTLYDYATRRNPNVKSVKLEDTNFFTPKDTSLNLQKWIDYKSSKSIATPHTNCRVCGSANLKKYLDLGLMPLANNLEFTAQRAKAQEKYPLQIMFCENCALSQLSVVINPEKMFSNYAYRSSINKPYVEHCRLMAKTLRDKYKLNENCFHIDIAGNDGSLLKEFKEEIGLKVLNVDPATNLVAIAEAQGIPCEADFWSLTLAKKLQSKYGGSDLITATNVFAHVNDVRDFITGASVMLKKYGVLVIECPYVIDFIEDMEHGTSYFEHVSYMAVTPMYKLCEDLGMKIIAVSKHSIHCGTIRVEITHGTNDMQIEDSVNNFLQLEETEGFNKFERYANWSNDVKLLTKDFEDKIIKLKKEGSTIAAFGASAKGNTLLNYSGMNTDIIRYIVDETPEKINKFSPANGIKIVGLHHIEKDPTDYMIILAWNFKDVIMDKLRKKGYQGKFIIPIPKFTVL